MSLQLIPVFTLHSIAVIYLHKLPPWIFGLPCMYCYMSELLELQVFHLNLILLSGINWEVKAPIQSSFNYDDSASLQKNPDEPIRRSKFNKSIANLLVLRGKELQEADTTSFFNKNL